MMSDMDRARAWLEGDGSALRDCMGWYEAEIPSLAAAFADVRAEEREACSARIAPTEITTKDCDMCGCELAPLMANRVALVDPPPIQIDWEPCACCVATR